MKTKLMLSIALAIAVLLLALVIINSMNPRPLPEARRVLPTLPLAAGQSLAGLQTATKARTAPASPSPTSVQAEAPGRAAAGQPLVRPNPLDAPAWTVPYGKEFWRQPAARVAVDPKRSGTTNAPASLNIGDVIERVRHALGQSEKTAEPQVAAKTYTASFDGKGLAFSPHRPSDVGADWSENEFDLGADRDEHNPSPDPETQFTLRPVAMRRGDATLYAAATAAPEWSYVGNTAQARLNEQAGLVEHYELRSDGARLSGPGDGGGRQRQEMAAGGKCQCQ